MKFPQLPIGARFTLNGEEFVKSGPLTARRQSNGETRMIPRSAPIVVSEEKGGNATAKKTSTISADALRQALTAHQQKCLEICAGDDSQARTAALEQAYRDLLAELGLG